MKTDKSLYEHGNKVVITGQIPTNDFNANKAKNIKFSITSPENKIITKGEFAPNLDGSFSYETFAMDTVWKIDGEYIFNFNFNTINSHAIITYDNAEFDASSIEAVATPPVATPPVATPPVATPPVATPPVATPPVATPPVATPPVATPPVATPPVATPPVATPPVATPPVATPPVATPPVVELIMEQKIVEKVKPTCGTGTEDVDGICQVIQTEEKSKGGGCLIATATYGSEMATEVQQLRELRDNQLMNTKSGSAFMGTFNDIYYSFSPIIADYERENPYFKEAVKIAITPMISSLSLMEYAETESEVLGIGLSVIMLNLAMYLGVPAIVVVGIRKRF